jgi:23S rRNA-/tRNA-specific pseudouridylate synthase
LKELAVLYRDERIVAVSKPSGLLVHRSEIDRHETGNAMRILRSRTHIPIRRANSDPGAASAVRS